MGEARGVGGGAARGRRVVNRGKLLLLHWGLVLWLVWVVVARVTGVAPAPLATSCCATLPAGGAVVVRVGRGLGLRLGLGLWLGAGLWQQRRRSGLSLVQEFVCLLYFVSFCLNLSRQVLSPKLQGLQGRWRRKRGGQRVGNVWTVVGKISSRDSCLGCTLCAGFGIHSVATKCTVNACWSTIFNFTHQFGVQGEIGLPPTIAVI